MRRERLDTAHQLKKVIFVWRGGHALEKRIERLRPPGCVVRRGVGGWRLVGRCAQKI
jgi:hypothetical protein